MFLSRSPCSLGSAWWPCTSTPRGTRSTAQTPANARARSWTKCRRKVPTLPARPPLTFATPPRSPVPPAPPPPAGSASTRGRTRRWHTRYRKTLFGNQFGNRHTISFSFTTQGMNIIALCLFLLWFCGLAQVSYEILFLQDNRVIESPFCRYSSPPRSPTGSGRLTAPPSP